MMQRRNIVFSVFLVLFFLFFFQTSSYAVQYKVKKGDNLSVIAQKTGVSVADIRKANNLTSKKLRPGQVLKLSKKNAPSPTIAKAKAKAKAKDAYAATYKVKKGDTLNAIARKTGVPVKQIAELNNVSAKNLHVGRNLILSKPIQSASTANVAANDEEEEDFLEQEEEDLALSDAESEIESLEKANEELLGKWGSLDERKLFVKVSTGFLGAPYRFGGATVRGIDCSAFVRKMYEFFDISLPRTAREQSAVGIRVDRDELEEGDLVFFRTKKPIGHVGIYIGDDKFVHASYKGKSVRIDSLNRPYFQKRFQRAVRVKGLDENDGT